MLKITTWHGEGRSLFYVISVNKNEWEVLASFEDRSLAERFIEQETS